MANDIIESLKKGDMRTTGSADKVAKMILKDSSHIKAIFSAIESDNPGLRMRAADALEKAAYKKPEILNPYKHKLLKIAESENQQEVQWHLAQMLTYVPLTSVEAKKAVNLMKTYYHQSKSNIVKVFALTALVHFAKKDKGLEKKVRLLLNEALTDSPSVKSRAKKLLSNF